MTERELYKYAIVGMLARLKAEEELLQKAKTNSRKEEIQRRIDIITKHYNDTLKKL